MVRNAITALQKQREKIRVNVQVGARPAAASEVGSVRKPIHECARGETGCVTQGVTLAFCNSARSTGCVCDPAVGSASACLHTASMRSKESVAFSALSSRLPMVAWQSLA